MTEPVPVVVVGDLMTDVVVHLTDAIANHSDTRAHITMQGGGSGANTAAWLASCGVAVTFIGARGDDAAGREREAELATGRVTPRLAVDPTRPTGTCVVLIDASAERTMLPDAGANSWLRPEHLPAEEFRTGGHLHLSGYTLVNPRTRDAALAALQLARAAGMTTSVDPATSAPLEAVGPATFLDWVAGVDLLLPNAAEARILTGHDDPLRAGTALLHHFGEVVVKLGPAGALWCGQGAGAVRVAAEPVAVVDTTGAGDAFAAGFLRAAGAGGGPEDALRAGCALAAAAVGAIGGRPLTR